MNNRERADELLNEAGELAQQGDHAGARERLQAVLDLSVDEERRSWALHGMAHAFLNGGEPPKAEPCFRQITELRGADPQALCEAHVALGYSHAAAKRWSKAREAFDRALAVDGGRPSHRASARFHSARSYHAEGDDERARRELEAFLEMPQPYPTELGDAKRLLRKLMQE